MKRDYCGFCNGKTPMQQGRIASQLEKRVRWKDNSGKVRVTSEEEFVANRILREGYTPDVIIEEYGYHYESGWYGREKVWGKLEKPKTIYTLSSKKDNTYNEINKTVWGFARYISERFATIEDFSKEIENEQDRIRAAEEESKRKEQEAIEAEEKAAREKEEFERYCTDEIIKLANTKIYDVAAEVFKKEYGEEDFYKYQLNGFFHKGKREFVEGVCRNMILYICAREIDNPLAKDRLIRWLYNDNKASIKMFEAYSGVKMPKTYKKRVALIERLTSKDINLMAVN